jgi:hypothetical protein
MRMVEQEAGFNSIYEDLAQMEETDLALNAMGVGMIMRQQSLARLMRGWRVRMEQTLSWTCFTWSEATGVQRSLCRHCHAQRMIREAEGGPGQFFSTCVCKL